MWARRDFRRRTKAEVAREVRRLHGHKITDYQVRQAVPDASKTEFSRVAEMFVDRPAPQNEPPLADSGKRLKLIGREFRGPSLFSFDQFGDFSATESVFLLFQPERSAAASKVTLKPVHP